MKATTPTALAAVLLLAAGLGGCGASTPSPARSGAAGPGPIVGVRPALDELVIAGAAQLHPAPPPPPAREVVPDLPDVADPGLVTLQVGGLRAPHVVETVRVAEDGTWSRSGRGAGEARAIRSGRLDAAALGALRAQVARARADQEVRPEPCDAMSERRLRLVLGARGVVSWASPCGGDVGPGVDEVVATLGRL